MLLLLTKYSILYKYHTNIYHFNGTSLTNSRMGTSLSMNTKKRSASESSEAIGGLAAPTIPSPAAIGGLAATIPCPAAASASRYDEKDDEVAYLFPPYTSRYDEKDDEEGFDDLPELVDDNEDSDDEDETFQQSAKKRAVGIEKGSTYLFPPLTSKITPLY